MLHYLSLLAGFFPQFLFPYLFNIIHIVIEAVHVDTIEVRPAYTLQKGKNEFFNFFFFKRAGFELVSTLRHKVMAI